jgi:hypothetical protein
MLHGRVYRAMPSACRTKVRFGMVEAINGNIKTLLRRGRGAGLYEFWCRALLPYLFVSSIIVLVRGGARKLSVPGCVLTLGRNLDLRRLHKRRIRIGVSKHLAGRVGNVSGIKSGL